MRCLIVYCHPLRDSFSAAIRDHVLAQLAARDAACRVHDLYAEKFLPILSGSELVGYANLDANQKSVQRHVEDLLWADTLIFVYPTWWYGLPAMLKGWMDRVLLPGVAFQLPKGTGDNISAGLTHITRLGVFTTCGASSWLTFLIGAPGKRTLLRGLRLLCHRRCKTMFVAHYNMDSSTPQTRAAHFKRITRTLARF